MFPIIASFIFIHVIIFDVFFSNLGSLAELVKDGTRMIHHPQNQKQPQVLQHMQQQAPQRLPQQVCTHKN